MLPVGVLDAARVEHERVTFALVGAAVSRLGVPVDELLRAFGAHWIDFARRSGYGDLLELVGRDLPDFLDSLDSMHARLGLTFRGMYAPSFAVRRIADDQLELAYTSARSGLAPFVEGLLAGLGRVFACRVEARLVRPRGEGSPSDIFSVRFEPAGAPLARTQ